MATTARLLKLIGPFGWWIVLGVLLSAATSVASVGLMAVSAYLISKAAVSTTLVDLTLLYQANVSIRAPRERSDTGRGFPNMAKNRFNPRPS